MGKRQIGVVKDLFRYPVKSMLGERLGEIDVGEQGVVGDRAYALRETSGRVVSAKKWAGMLRLRARYEGTHSAGKLAPVEITLPDGRTIRADDPEASAVLSGAVGRAVVLERPQRGQKNRAEIDPATVFADVPVEEVMPDFSAATLPDTFPLPPGTFFDSAVVHVLATGTLAHLRQLIGEDARLDPLRFRPNVVVETPPGVGGFVEDDWIGGALELGGSVRFVALRPALRCAMTTHSQGDLARDPRILRGAVRHHRGHVGVFAGVGTPGSVRVGDPVTLET